MKTPKTIVLTYNDGTLEYYDPYKFEIVSKEEYGIAKAYVPEEVISPEAKSLRETFYKLVEALNYPKATKYTPKRLKQLKTRLKTFSEQELLQAANGITQNVFLQGENQQKKRYGTIDYLLRSDEIIDTYVIEGTSTDIDLTSLEII
jgi:hypothetical protein